MGYMATVRLADIHETLITELRLNRTSENLKTQKKLKIFFLVGMTFGRFVSHLGWQPLRKNHMI